MRASEQADIRAAGEHEAGRRLLSSMTGLVLVQSQMKGAGKGVDITVLWETLRIWHFPPHPAALLTDLWHLSRWCVCN